MKYLARTGWGLYALRYQIAYVVLFILLGWLLWLTIDTPGALTRAEYDTTVASSALSVTNFDPSTVAYAPYYALQKMGFLLLGVTTLSIKLPSVILGLLTLVICYFLLQLWFNRRVALLGVTISATNGPFLYYLQSGTPDIMYMFVPALVLLAATLLSRTKNWHLAWKLLLAAGVLLSLYTPAAIYVLVAMLIATLFHPHVRYVAFHLSRWRLFAAGVVLLIGVIPIIAAISQDPVLLPTLLGLSTVSWDILGNASQLAQMYVRFDMPSLAPVSQPLYSLPLLFIALIGLGKLLTTKYIARSYIVLSWLVLLLLLLLLNPQFGSVLFVPMLLLVGFGLRAIIRYWYDLFPFNPYARATGLVMLVLVLGTTVATGIGQYNTAYRYSPDTGTHFSHDLELLNTWQNTTGAENVGILPRAQDQAFYTAVASHTKGWNLYVNDATRPYVLEAEPLVDHIGDLQTILTDGTQEDADRFYIYKLEMKSATIEESNTEEE